MIILHFFIPVGCFGWFILYYFCCLYFLRPFLWKSIISIKRLFYFLFLIIISLFYNKFLRNEMKKNKIPVEKICVFKFFFFKLQEKNTEKKELNSWRLEEKSRSHFRETHSFYVWALCGGRRQVANY